MQDRTGAKILVKGRGSQRDGAPDLSDDEELHVALEGSEVSPNNDNTYASTQCVMRLARMLKEGVEKAMREIEDILYNPEKAMKLKAEQLAGMNSSSSLVSSANIYGPGNDDVSLLVPNSMVGLIIGRGGENIQRMQMQTGGHLQIQKGFLSQKYM